VLRAHVVGVASCLAVVLTSGLAPAETSDSRREEILDAEGPPSLPSLSHRWWAFLFEYTVASAKPTDVSSAEPIDDERAYAYAARWLLEIPIVERIWYVGASLEIGAASVPSSAAPGTGGSTMVLANPELWTRALWSSASGLGAGGGMALVVPVPRTFSALEGEVVRAIRTVRPTDYTHFQDQAFTVRPYFDLRHVTGPVTLQLRQGLDITVLLRDLEAKENRYDLAGLITAYVGVRTVEQLTLGLEVGEVYQITADTSAPACIAPCDQHRTQFTLSPSVRLRLPRISPSFSALFPLSTPLRAEVASYYAARLHLDVLF
jgi:hypothetical protein